jgi:hypothetical protein
MTSLPSAHEDHVVEPALAGGLLLDLLGLAGWEIHVSLHDLGVKVFGRRGADEIVRFGRSVADVAIEFFKAAHETEPPDVTPAVHEVLVAILSLHPLDARAPAREKHGLIR